jgi:hypothetical protein
LQTSDALGAAAAQLGPDARAAVVELNKQGGLSHGKVVRCLKSLFGIPLGLSAFRGGWLTCSGPAWTCATATRRERSAGTASPWPAVAWRTNSPTTMGYS